jgi:HK97 family phage portal protein
VSFLASLLSPRADGSPWDDRFFGNFQGSFATDSGVVLNADGAMALSGVYACVRVLTEPLAQVPLILYRRTSDGGKERASEEPLYEVLHDSPNGWQTSFAFRKLLQSRAVLKGNGYARVVPGKRGAVDQLLPLDPDRMTVAQLNTGRIVYEYRDAKTGAKQTYSQDEMLHIRGPYGDGVAGIPTLTYARNCFGMTKATEIYGAKFFANMAKPGAVIKHPGKLSELAANNLKASLAKAHSSVEDSFKSLVLEEGMELQSWGINNEQAQFLSTRQFQLDEICRWFNVPPHKVQNLLRSTNNNIEHQSLEFTRDTMGPWYVNWEQEITRTLVLPTLGPDYYAEFLVDGLMRGDAASRSAYYQSGIQSGWLMRNEVRERENLNKLPGLDDPPPMRTPLGAPNRQQPPADNQNQDGAEP